MGTLPIRNISAWLIILAIASQSSAQVVVEINAGSPSDTGEQVTSSFKYSKSPSLPISDTDDGVPYTSHRWSRSVFTYTFDDLVAGSYKLSLGFAEIYPPGCESGKRVFNVVVNSAILLNGLDVFDEAGECNKALMKTLTVSIPEDGIMTVDFQKAGPGNPFVSLIELELLAGGSTSPPTTSSPSSGTTENSSSSSMPSTTVMSSSSETTESPSSTTELTTTVSVPSSALTEATSTATSESTPLTDSSSSSPTTGSFSSTLTSPTSSATQTTASLTFSDTESTSTTEVVSTTGVSPANSILIDINAGADENSDPALAGDSRKSSVPPSVPIANTEDPSRYRSHRFLGNGQSFSYSFLGAPGETYTVQLGFAETWIPGCNVGVRVFSVFANENLVLEDLDVFSEAGCRTALLKNFVVQADSTGEIVLQFARNGGSQNPYISSIIISSSDGASTSSTVFTTLTTQLGTTTASNSTTATIISSTTILSSNRSSIQIDAGSLNNDLDDSVSGMSQKSEVSTAPIEQTTDDVRYQTYRSGLDFTYSIDLQPDVYDVTLGFAETAPENCQNSSRVFTVIINNQPPSELLTSIDVFQEAGACNTAFSRTIRQEVTGTLTLQFVSVVGDAFISTIDATPAVGCSLVIGSNGGQDHRAHAVPGTYPEQVNAASPKSYTDFDGDGFETVTIDGFRSHTHYQDDNDPENPIAGSIVEYKWTNIDTEEVLSTSSSFQESFPLGTTRILLEVVDSTCDRAEAETTVTVTGAVAPGAYCYYYGASASLVGGGLGFETVKPVFSSERAGSFAGQIPQPPAALGEDYSVRCLFFYEVDEDSETSTFAVSTAGSGTAKVFKGLDLVLDTVETPSAGIALSTGLSEFEVLYTRSDVNSPPELTISVNGTAIPSGKVSYDRSTVLPVLTSVGPTESDVSGGVDVVVTGYGFYKAPYFSFGEGEPVQAKQAGLLPTSCTVTTPARPQGIVQLTASASNGGIQSNSLNFQYGEDVDPPILFSTKIVKEGGLDAESGLATCIALHGNSWYLGALFGRVRKLTVSPELIVTSRCESPILTDDSMLSPQGKLARVDILGITFDPADTVGKPYVSAQTLFWFYRNKVDSSNKDAWKNGRIERLAPGGGCLEVESRIVSGLPVSDHDHGVNGLQFDNSGDLYAAVGGATNGGLAGTKFGDMWETPLSACIVKIKLSLGEAFDGQITYDRNYDDHKNALQTGGDVEVFTSGLRNSFDIAYTSQEEIYGTDNGPNSSFGRYSTECNQTKTEGVADTFGRPDKIYKATAGAYLGHPNLNRGECQYINPFTDKDLADPPRLPLPSLNYVDEINTVQASNNGIIEYTAAHFGSALKGELISTNYAPNGKGKVFRKKIGGQLLVLHPTWGGLSVAQGVFGELIFPRAKLNTIHILQPDYPFPAGLSARVVTPFRGGSAGGLVVTITGHGFGNSDPTVSINGNSCPVVPGSVTETSRGSLLQCVTPANSGGATLVDVEVTTDVDSSILSEGFMYSAV